MNIGPSDNVLKELVKKKKIPKIMRDKTTKPIDEDSDDMNDEDMNSKPSLLKKKKMPMKRKSIFSKLMK